MLSLMCIIFKRSPSLNAYKLDPDVDETSIVLVSFVIFECRDAVLDELLKVCVLAALWEVLFRPLNVPEEDTGKTRHRLKIINKTNAYMYLCCTLTNLDPWVCIENLCKFKSC